MSKSKRKQKKNITKKNKTEIMPRLSTTQKQAICKKHATMFKPFEHAPTQKDIKIGENLQKKTVVELKQAISPSEITPQDNFYGYINYKWLKELNLEEQHQYLVQIDDFRIVQDKVFRELLEIAKEYIKNNKTEKAREMNDVLTSMIKLNSKAQVQSYGKKYVEFIDDLSKNKENLWTLMGYFNTNEIISWGCPFSWSLNPDDKNPGYFCCYVGPPQVSLIDLDVYFDDGVDVEYKANYKKQFFKYIRRMFEFVFGPGHGYNVHDVFDVEYEILMAMGCETVKKQAKDGYNKVTTKEALRYGFNWPEFASALGFTNTPSYFVTGSLDYLKCGSEMLMQNWDTKKWKTYWIYIYIRQLIRFNKESDDINFDFNGDFVRGQEKSLLESSKEINGIFGLCFTFNTFLSNEYYDRYENKPAMEYIHNLFHDLKAVFTRIIMRNKWLEPKTKKYALQKFAKFELITGKPKDLREDPLLQYNNDDAWGNLLKVCNWRHRQAVRLEGKQVIDIPAIDWSGTPFKLVGNQCYVVNASYTPAKNSIYIPLGYIQKPFIDLDERGIEYNLAFMGYTLAHEMSHALDDWGSKYDEHGKLSDWWTDKDKAKFKKIQQDVIKQYEVYASYDGIDYDAAHTIGEDIADISGLAICVEYLRDFQEKNKDVLPIKSLSFNAFFIYFAIQYRQHIKKKAMAAQLRTNPHPPDTYRTNVPLSRSPIFRANYNIQKGDKMWWHNTNRVWE
jgi:putative endopeptidase